MREACIAYYSAEIPVDHITDHLPFRSIRKQWTEERRRVRFSERKGAEKVIFSGNCPYRSVWDHQAAGSIPVTRTKKPLESSDSRGFLILFSIVAKTVICYNIYDYTNGGIYFAYFILRL